MNIALIFAGGIGKRMNTTGIPKQFLKLYGKEIIVYTLEIFENNQNIDGIVISCLKEKIEDIGGLEGLKEWLKSKAQVFRRLDEAKKFGVDTPK